MPIQGAQDIWVPGSRLYFQRDPIQVGSSAAVVQPILDIGRIGNAAPSISAQDQTLYDADGGIARPIAVVRTRVDETYDITASNLNMDNLALLFNALPPSSFTQAVTPITATHDITPGRLVKLHDAAGVPVYGVTSVTSVGTLVAGDDYEFVNPERGFVRIIPESEGGSVASAGTMAITFVPRVITGPNRRLILPQTGGCVSTGTAMIFWGRCGNAQQSVREVRVAMAPTGGTFPDENYADMRLRLTVLSDPTKPVPAGRLLYWLGSEPSLS